MALALLQAAPLKPEIRLSQALKDYEAALTEEQKMSFHRTSPPEPHDVMALTFEINRQNEGRKSRIWGARLTTFLNSVKGFTAIVDTVIGSVGNPIAGAVWGAVKTAIQAASIFESYYDALSTMLMNVGQSAPRYEAYALLYPASAGLRKELCNYFSVVIDICKATVMFVTKRFVFQTWDALRKTFNDEFVKYQRELVKFGDAVRDEVSLAAKQQQNFDSIEEVQERRKMSLFRRAGTLFQNETAYQLAETRKWRELRIKSHFLDSCSTHNHETALNQARRKGRSSWLFETNEYKEWKSSASSSVLLCSGIVGAGKTVLSASVIEELTILRAVDSSVGFFFCRHDDLESLKARAIMGSLARQLLSSISAKSFQKANEATGTITLNIEQVVSHLLDLLPPENQYFVVLDGLDECESEEANHLFETLQNLLRSPIHTFKLLWTGRSNYVARVNKQLQSNFHVSISQSKNGFEISNFIELALDEALEDGRLQLQDPQIIVRVQDALEKGAGEMFLWVAFQIKSICRENTDEGVLNALEDLPQDMPTTYRRILRRLRDSGFTDPVLAKRIFEIVSAARRPLSLEELREAISIEPGNTTWNIAKLVNNVMKSLDCCGSLIVVDEELSSIHFAHSSVKQYLEAKPEILDVAEYHIIPKDANFVLGGIVVTYLNLDVFQEQVTKYSRASTAVSPQNTSQLLRASLHLSTVSSSSLARKVLKNRKTPEFDIGRELEKVAGFTRESRVQVPQARSLLSYAQEHWLPHTVSFQYHSFQDPDIYVLWTQLIEGRIPTVMLPWTSEDVRASSAKFLDSVVRSNNSALIQYTLRKLSRQVREGFPRMQRLLELIPFQALLGDEKCYPYDQALELAVHNDRMAVARLLLDKTPADANAADRRYRTMLEIALENRSFGMFEILVEHGADVNAVMWIAAYTPIYAQAIPLLLARGAKRLSITESLEEDIKKRLQKVYSAYDKEQQQRNEGEDP